MFVSSTTSGTSFALSGPLCLRPYALSFLATLLRCYGARGKDLRLGLRLRASPYSGVSSLESATFRPRTRRVTLNRVEWTRVILSGPGTLTPLSVY